MYSSSKECQGSQEVWGHSDQESSSCLVVLCASVSYSEKEELLWHTWQCGSWYVGGFWADPGEKFGRVSSSLGITMRMVSLPTSAYPFLLLLVVSWSLYLLPGLCEGAKFKLQSSCSDSGPYTNDALVSQSQFYDL